MCLRRQSAIVNIVFELVLAGFAQVTANPNATPIAKFSGVEPFHNANRSRRTPQPSERLGANPISRPRIPAVRGPGGKWRAKDKPRKRTTAANPALVAVNRQPGDRLLARYEVADILEPHWEYTSGGEGKAARLPSFYAYVWCDAAVEGRVAHTGVHGGECPHRIAVHVPSKHNDSDVMNNLRSTAGSKPRSRHGFSPLFHNNAREPGAPSGPSYDTEG